MAAIRPLVKGYGGKFLLRHWIIGHLPSDYPRLNYVEPYVMGGSVLLNKLPSVREMVSDIDPSIYAVWRVTQNNWKDLQQRLKQLSFSEATLRRFCNGTPSTLLEHAVRRMVISRMSVNGMGTRFANCPRKRGGQQGDKNAWQTFVDRELPKIAERIEHVEISCEDAVQAINRMAKRWPGRTVFYLDPPYVPDTRTSRRVYEFEMSPAQHEDLLEHVLKLADDHAFLISGYDNELYNDMLSGWHKSCREAAMNVAIGKQKRRKVEVLWYNYDNPVIRKGVQL